MPRENLQQLTAKLRSSNRRVTGPRAAVLEVMRDEAHPLTIRQIHNALTEPCDLATVYRSLRLLESMDMVKRFDFGDGTARFELLHHGDDGHHHHLICRQCKSVIELHGCFSDTLQQRIAVRHGYRDVTHQLEFFGTCPECQA